MSKREPVAVVSRLVRYPLKSAAGESVQATQVGWHGLRGDRRFAFLRPADPSGFPWLTAREVPELVTWRAAYVDPANPQHSDVFVQVPGEAPVSVRDGSLLTRLMAITNEPIQLAQLWSGIFDADDLAIITTSSIEAACAAASVAVDARRFRANVEVRPLEPGPFAEDRWVDSRFIFGDRQDSARVRVCRRDKRCVVVNIDPSTGTVMPGMFEGIVVNRKNNLGVYAKTEGPGSIAVGDTVYRLR